MARARYNTQNQGPNFTQEELNLKDTLEQLRNINLSAQEFQNYLDRIKRQGVSVNQEFAKLDKQLKGLGSESQDLYNILKGIGVELGKDNQYYKEGTKAFNNLLLIAEKLKDNSKGNLNLSEKDLKLLEKKVEKYREILTNPQGLLRELEIKENNNTATQQELNLLGEIRGAKQFLNTQSGQTLDLYQALTDEVRNQVKYQNDIGKQLGLSGGIIRGMTNILQRFGLTQFTGIDELNEELRISAERIVNNKEKFGQLKIAGQAFWGVLKEGFSQANDPLIKFGAFTYLFKELIQYTLLKIFQIL